MSRITPLSLGFANAILVQETGAIMIDAGAPRKPTASFLPAAQSIRRRSV